MERQDSSLAANPPFVGRERHLKDLTCLLDFAPRTRTAARLIIGPAGVGKSRLAQEFSHLATTRAMRVVSARCWSSTHSPTYWPWTQIFRELLNAPRALDFTELVLEDPLAASTFELFDTVVTLLREESERNPLVLVLEDLHVLDPSSLTLLNYISHALADSNVVIVGTARTLVDKLAKCFDSHLVVDPFTLEETALYLDGWAGPHLNQVFAATGGLPLHLDHLMHGPALGTGPDSAQAASPLISLLRTRLDAVDPVTLEVLTTLAVLDQVSEATLGAILGLTPDVVADSLRRSKALYLTQDCTRGQSCVQFVHQIVLDAVLELAGAAQIQRIHAKCAAHFDGSRLHEVQYARHLIQAGPEYVPRAVAACRIAATKALNQLAFEDGIELCRLALQVIPTGHPSLLPEQVHLAILLASALWQIGDRDGALSASQDAWELSAHCGVPHLRVLAAHGPRFGFDFSGDLPRQIASRCSQVLAEQPGLDPASRARVYASLAMAQLTLDPAQATQTAKAAVQFAQITNCAAALGYALLAQCATDLAPDSLFLRLTTAQRVLAIAAETNERALVAPAWFLFLGSLLEQGEIGGIDRELAENSPLVVRFTELQDSRHSSWFRCLRAILDGDIEVAEQLLALSLERAQAENDPDALTVWGAQFSVLSWIQGDYERVEPLLRQATQEHPNDPVWAASLAWLWSRSGRTVAVQGLLEKLGPICDLPRDRNWLATIAILAEVAVNIADRDLMSALREQLAPYSDRLVPIGLGVSCWGTVDRPLGLIAHAQGNTDLAIKHYEAAMALCARTGAQVWLAQAQTELASILTSGPHQDRERAASLATEAYTASNLMGWRGLAVASKTVLKSVGSPEPQTSIASEAPLETNAPVIRVLGRFEVVNEFGTVRWTSKRARTLLKILVANRGSPVSRARLLDILWPTVSHDFLANRFAVALTTVRRALDPSKSLDLQHYVTFDGEYVALQQAKIDTDVERFLDLAHQGLSRHSHDELAGAVRLYLGEAFSDEFAAIWAEPLREEAQMVYLDAAHLLANMSEPARACDLYRSILALDEFDLAAHEGLTNALFALGAPRQAEVAQSRANAILKELED